MNELKHLDDFSKVLRDYKISDKGKQILSEVQLVLLAAPTSSGRNTIIRELLKTDNYHYIVSDTTRKQRINDGELEQNGVQYWFRNEDEILEDLRAGQYLEAAIIHKQQVSGISLRELEIARQKRKIAVTDIEMMGVENIIKAKPDTIVIFVIPPDFKTWQKRIYARGTMDIDEYARRLASSQHELRHALEMPYYHFVVNDNLQSAVEQIHQIATHANTSLLKEHHNREVVEQLCRDTAAHLKKL